MSRFNNRSSYNDLLLFGVNHYILTVNDELHELYGIVCSDSESEDDNLLESYLTQTKTVRSPSQSMARTKQTAWKSTGRTPGRSAGGIPLARFGSPVTRSQGSLLEGDSELEEAANLYSVNMPQLRSRSSPGSSSTPGTSPARGRGRSKSPGSARGKSPGRGKSPKETPIVGAGRSVPVGLPVADPPRPSRLRGFLSGKKGQVVRGGGDASLPDLQTATPTTSTGRNSLKRLLPSFSSDDDDSKTAPEGGDQDYTPDDDDDEEVTFKNQGQPPRKRLRTVPVAQKNLNLIRGNRRKRLFGFKKVSNENRQARTLAYNEMKRGWYKKLKKREGAPRSRPGILALREIRFYQKSQVLLIPMRPFIRFVRELALEHKTMDGGHFRWQASALYALQQAAESYMVGLFDDVVILAIHCKRVTVMRDDIRMVLRLRSRRPLNEPMADT